jgi:elongation factor Ts
MAEVTAAMVKELRERTQAGMMDCKKALVASNGDMDAAVEYLREKGLAAANKKSGRIAAEGAVDSYIHMGGKIGVLVEAQCDAPSDAIKDAMKNVAMQIAAMNPQFIADSDVDQAYIDHETEILKAQMDADPKEAAKPENVKQGIIKGRVNKLLKDVVLLDQVYVRAEDGKQSVAQYLATVSKDLKLTKFVRFEVGEGMEKKNEDFAAEVAAQMK